MAYKRSVFPESGYDVFKEKYDVSPDKEILVDEYYALWKMTDRTALEEDRLNQLAIELEPYLYTAEHINHYQDAMSNVQKFFVENTQGHIDGLKVETRDYVDGKKVEIDTAVISGQTAINTTKDNALISIEQKKENIIDYMDGTTAGALRNDIGALAESTVEGANLVEKINALDAKTVDLTPIENKIGDLSSMTTDEKSNLADAVSEVQNEIKTHSDDNITSHNVSRGTSTFAGSGQEVTIPHGLSVVPVSAYAFPTVNSEGYLGEVWIRMDETNLYIGNSGSFTGVMSWTAIG